MSGGAPRDTNEAFDAALRAFAHRAAPEPASDLLGKVIDATRENAQRPAWTLFAWPVLAAFAVATVVAIVAIGLTGGRVPQAGVGASGTPPPPSRSSLPPAGADLRDGTLAVARGDARVLAEPNGNGFGQLEEGSTVLVIDEESDRGERWYRIEFEYCCRPDAPSGEWVFGWVAADLDRASALEPDPGVGGPDLAQGPTLEHLDASCPATAQDLVRVPEPLRWQCYGGGESLVLTGQLLGPDPTTAQALYPGTPEGVTSVPEIAIAAAGIRPGDAAVRVHLGDDPLLLAWLNDERVKASSDLEFTLSLGAGAVECRKQPRIAGFPAMSIADAQLWCSQQLTLIDIRGPGGTPLVPAPMATPAWTPPADTQPASGPGWRLLASADRNQVAIDVGPPVAVATDLQAYERLWLSVGHGSAPEVDLAHEFVVRFVVGVSSTCPWIAFDGIGTSGDRLFGRFHDLQPELFVDDVSDSFGCTTDAVPHAFLVAIDRALAPSDEFVLALSATPTCSDCDFHEDEVPVDLRK